MEPTKNKRDDEIEELISKRFSIDPDKEPDKVKEIDEEIQRLTKINSNPSVAIK